MLLDFPLHAVLMNFHLFFLNHFLNSITVDKLFQILISKINVNNFLYAELF